MTDPVQRAEEAARILGSQIFEDAFSTLHTAYSKAWEDLDQVTDGDNAAKARDLHARLKVLRDVKSTLNKVIETGKLAAHAAEKQSKMSRLNPFATNRRSG